MAETVGALRAELSAEISAFRRDMNVAVREMKRGSAKMNRSLLSINKAQRKMVAGFRQVRNVVQSAAVLMGVRFARQQLAASQALQDTSEKIGFQVEQLQELRFAGQQYGVNQRTTDLALQRFSRRLGEAQNGTGELVKTLRQYNIHVFDAEGRTRSSADVLADLANKIAGAESQQERLSIAFKAFDSEGAAFVNVLKGGAGQLQEMSTRARELGVVMDESTVRKAAEASRKLDALSQVLNTKLTVAAADNADAIEAIGTAALNTAIKAVGAFNNIGQGLGILFAKLQGFTDGETLTDRLTDATKKLGDEQERLARLQDQLPSQDARRSFSQIFLDELEAQIAESEQRVTELKAQVIGVQSEISGVQSGLFRNQEAPAGTNVGSVGGGAGSGEGGSTPEGPAGELQNPFEVGTQMFREAWTKAREDDQKEWDKWAEQRGKVIEETLRSEIQQEREKNAIVAASRQQLAQLSIGFLQALGVRNKAFQIATIALETIMSIKRFKIHNMIAAQLAYASQLVPGDPTSLARAEAVRARVLAQGLVGVGLIAATGAISALNNLEDAAPLGSASNPAFTTTSATPTQGGTGAAGFVDRGSSQIFIDTVIGSETWVRQVLVPVLADEFDRDVVIIRQGSKQSAVIRRGGS